MAIRQEQYWRIRIQGRNQNFGRQAWDQNEIGIWYGAWSAEDWQVAETQADPLGHLNRLPRQLAVGWGVTKSGIDTARRFTKIRGHEWVVLFFEDALHLACVTSEMFSREDHPLNGDGEIFKYRHIADKKTFLLSHLPDSYRLIPSAGRGNVHEFSGTNWELVKILAASRDEEGAVHAMRAMAPMEWLDLLGPAGWESFCVGYLILSENFVPTGLLTGRTLRALDIVGRNAEGRRILAQCKKSSEPMAADADFLEAVADLTDQALIYFFSYGGCLERPPWLRVVDREAMQRWIDTEAGRNYFGLWR